MVGCVKVAADRRVSVRGRDTLLQQLIRADVCPRLLEPRLDLRPLCLHLSRRFHSKYFVTRTGVA